MNTEENIFHIESGDAYEEEKTYSDMNEEDDEDFYAAVETLVALENQNTDDEEEHQRKKQKIDENGTLSDRQLLHRIMGCRHCKCKLGYVEDVGIHKRIDEIFNKMKQTVVVS